MRHSVLLIIFAAWCGAQTTVNGGRDYKGSLKASGSVSAVDFSGAGSTTPVKVGLVGSLPAACTQGQFYFATDAAAGKNLYLCTTTGSPGTWSQMKDASPATTSGSGAPPAGCAPPAMYIDTTNQELWFCSTTNIWKKPAPDTSTIPTLAGANAWTGYNNLSAAQWRPPESTVANLPAPASNTGKVFMVTDAAAAGSCSTGGGAVRELCRAAGSSYECVGGCGSSGNGGGSGAAPYMSALIAGPDTTKTIPGAVHGFGTAALFVALYDNASPRNAVAAGWTVNASTYDVTITFAAPQSNYYVVINGGVGPQGPAGSNGTSGAGYLATSASAVSIASGPATFTTQSGLAYSVGARVRASSAASGSNYLEGLVTAYSGTTLTMNADTTGGSGSHADWNLNVSGNAGAAGANGSVYLATSATSFGVGTGSKVFATQSGLAYGAGTRVRASSAADGTNYMEGLVTSYSGSTLTVSVTATGGSGTHADWNINLTGDPGQNGTGSGTVTGVSFNGGLISVANPTASPALTVSGTSGGVPYFSGSSAWASSGALNAGQFVMGGGAGAAPATSFSLVPVVNGGTSLGTLTPHALYVGNGTSAPNAIGLGTTSQVLHGNGTGDPAFGQVQTADVAANAIGSAQMAVVNTRRACTIENDTQSVTALTLAQFSGHCIIPAAATIVEVDLLGGTGMVSGSATAPTVGGTGSIQIGKYSPNNGASTASLMSGALATAYGKACALASTSGTCINGNTSSGSVTIDTTSLSAGDVLYVSAAAPDGAQTWFNVTIFYTVN